MREDGKLEYNGGEIDVQNRFDVNLLASQMAEELCKTHGYIKVDNYYKHVAELGLEEVLKALKIEWDLLDMCIITRNNDYEMHIDFEHPSD